MINWMKRMAVEVPPRLLWKFAFNFGYHGMRAVNKFTLRGFEVEL